MNVLIFFIEEASLSADRRYFSYSIVLFEYAAIVYGFPGQRGAGGRAALSTTFIEISGGRHGATEHFQRPALGGYRRLFTGRA